METNEVAYPLSSFEVAQKVVNGELLLGVRPGRSRVWSVFSRIMKPDGEEIKEYVYCRDCAKVFKFNKLTTSNLVKHKCYIFKFVNTEQTENEVSLIKTETPKVTEFSEYRGNNLTKLLTRCIIKEYMPCDLIKNESLKAVFQEIASIGSKFGSDIDIEKLLPSLSEVDANVSEIYEQCLERVKTELISIKENGFGLTTDTWTDDFTKNIYIALTIHYLKNGVLTFRLLGLRTLKTQDLNQNVADKVKEILYDFDCNLSFKSIIVSNKDDKIREAFPNTQSITCISHLLNNVLQKSIEQVPEVAETVSASFELVNYLNKMGINNVLGNVLPTPYSNRWETIYRLLKAIETNWYEISKTLDDINDRAPLLAININHLIAITKSVQPFEEAIEALEDESDSTMHLVIVYLHELKKSCDTNGDELIDFEFIESLKENMRLNLDELVSKNISIIHKLALFLYPPTNKLLQFNDEDKKVIEAECIRLMKCFRNDLKPDIKNEPESPPAPSRKRRKLFSDFVESERNCDPIELINQELQYYKNTRVANCTDFDAFNWWEVQKENFPLLYKLNCVLLATPASTAASKRIFSSARSLLCDKHNRVSREMEIEKIIFINNNGEQDDIDSHISF